ncbi:hypothetical protein [Flavobacterium sp.]|uniref:hypothetical protein n=1 Tax=Flavobacterium sp. TaxID=239 RepID=UPI002632AD06|nr:hypothetical protein [Flavobacterium sp.]
MKIKATFVMLLVSVMVYSQKYEVSKTEVLVDAQENKWSPTLENSFIESVSLIPGGSVEITLPNKETVLIYKLEITVKADKDGHEVKTFSPPLMRGTDSEIEITFVDNKPAFAYGHSKGWNKSKPDEIVIFRLWF